MKSDNEIILARMRGLMTTYEATNDDPADPGNRSAAAGGDELACNSNQLSECPVAGDLRARLDNPGPCPLCEQSKREAAIAEENSRNYLKHAERVSKENDELHKKLVEAEQKAQSENDKRYNWEKIVVGLRQEERTLRTRLAAAERERDAALAQRDKAQDERNAAWRKRDEAKAEIQQNKRTSNYQRWQDALATIAAQSAALAEAREALTSTKKTLGTDWEKTRLFVRIDAALATIEALKGRTET